MVSEQIEITKDQNYLFAVKGRSDFRNAFRRERELRQQTEKRMDAYGVALMMIATGCACPQEFANKVLKDHGIEI
jgi:hypothetical protein